MTNFPDSPTVGQVFTAGNLSWRWDGTKWVMVTPAQGQYLPIAGGTMAGPLMLATDPSQDMQSANKRYVDTNDALKVNRTGDTVTGPLTVNNLISPQASGLNRIINGAMRVDQYRFASGVSLGYGIDRWQMTASLLGKGSLTRNLNAINGPPGFPNYLGWQTSVAYAPTGNDYYIIRQAIEADLISDFAWGTAYAQPVTFSFWVYSSLIGSFCGFLTNYTAGTRGYLFTYTIPTANTWTKIVVTIPGDTGGSWVMSGTSGGLIIGLTLGSGGNMEGTPNSWLAFYRTGVTGSVYPVTTLNAIFYVTGVKLEIGNVATAFPPPPISAELLECYRYYEKSYAQTATAGTTSANYGAYMLYNMPTAVAANATFSMFYKAVKRAAPTITFYSPTTGVSGKARDVQGAVDVAVNGISNADAIAFYYSTGVSGTQIQLAVSWTASAEL